jgi:3-oxoacyl-[acyl-carrier protein] reductase
VGILAGMTSGKTALVTGASYGLGRAIAVHLACRGHTVAVNFFRSQDHAEETVARCRAQGARAAAFQADVRDAAQVAAMVRRIQEECGEIGTVVHNATGPQPMRPVEEYSWDEYQDQLDYFVKAPVLVTQATLAPMKKARAGRIILIGSDVVDLGNANFSAYVAAKGAMVGLARAWATEFGPWGITVNLVAPGWIPVERHAEALPEERAAYAAGVPLRRQGKPADVAGAVAYLASEEANFVTGQCWAVNGGNTF